MSYEQLRPLIAQLPCPLPGLPPEIARYVDCSVLRPISDATAYQPIPTPTGMTNGVDHRTQGIVGPVRDQGETGSCSANAIASLIDTFVRKRGLGAQQASALHVFAIYEHTAVKGATDDNIGNLRRSPASPPRRYGPTIRSRRAGSRSGRRSRAATPHTACRPARATLDPTIVAERQRADGTPLYRVAGLEAIADTPERDGEIMKLLSAGEAVYLSVDMAINWSIAGPGGFHGDVLPPPQAYYGSHALLLQGYRTTPTGVQFLAQNSWGTNWGQNGFVWIPEDIFKSRVRAVYRIHVDMASPSAQVPAPLPVQVSAAPSATPAPGAPPPAPGCPRHDVDVRVLRPRLGWRSMNDESDPNCDTRRQLP